MLTGRPRKPDSIPMARSPAEHTAKALGMIAAEAARRKTLNISMKFAPEGRLSICRAVFISFLYAHCVRTLSKKSAEALRNHWISKEYCVGLPDGQCTLTGVSMNVRNEGLSTIL